MSKKDWQSNHLVGCPIKPLLGWRMHTQEERDRILKMHEELKRKMTKEEEDLEKADKALKEYERKVKLHAQADK